MAFFECQYEGFKTGGLAEIARNPNLAAKGYIKRTLEKGLQEARRKGIGYIAALTPVRTGKLQSSISAEVFWGGPQELDVNFFSEVDYASFVEEGTKFFTGRHMFERGINENAEALFAPLEAAIDDLVRDLEG